MKTILNILKWIILIFFIFVALYPLIWLLLASFKSSNLELQQNSFGLPEKWMFINYYNAMLKAKLTSLFFHSIIVATFAVLLNLIVASMTSFVISRENFKGKAIVFTVIVAGILIPIISFMVPYFSIIQKLKLYDSLLALILVYCTINIPISVFLLTSFMESIPIELEEAATIDGASFIQRFTKVILPLSQTGLATAGTFCFIYSWNEFIMALLLTSSESSRTLQLGIRFFTSQFVTDYTAMYAAIVITIIPSIVVYFIFQNRIISGLTAGAVKG
ncbi:MAG: carbohydrate ABC transporter permease [Spirochaetia bacterium]|jgi:raffinose/stachyose/melibiose transport system permease protein|nr:carbohydrate ABC transporter permease [Spirochaetia bacterium]